MSLTFHCIPVSLAFQRAILKSWEWLGDKATTMQCLDIITNQVHLWLEYAWKLTIVWLLLQALHSVYYLACIFISACRTFIETIISQECYKYCYVYGIVAWEEVCA